MSYSQDKGKDADLAGKCNPEDCCRSKADSGIVHLSIQDTREQRHCIVSCSKDRQYFTFMEKQNWLMYLCTQQTQEQWLYSVFCIKGHNTFPSLS